MGELIGSANFGDGILEGVRSKLVSYLEQNSDIHPTKDSVINHFHSLGLEKELGGIMKGNVVELSPFASPRSDYDKVREGWMHVWGMMQKQDVKKELASTSLELARNPSDLLLSRLTEVAMLSFDDYKELDKE